MTKEEAIEAMKSGRKVRHRFFAPHEWVTSNLDGTIYFMEDGVECTADEFWMWRLRPEFNDNWEFYPG